MSHFYHFLKYLVISLITFSSLQANARTAFVHLFEWQWDDIAIECEQHLGPKGFAAVQVSPPQKSINRGEWWSRYQPLSYAIEGRSGGLNEFANMVGRCKAQGVDIYVDAIINHMAALDRNFPEVPYGPNDFHDCRTDINYQDRWQVQNCDLVGLNDLKTESEYVRNKIAEYMNFLIDLGVAGFRIDAAKHIPASDIAAIRQKLKSDVYIFQEVIRANEPIQPEEYVGNGDVTEFNFERKVGSAFKGREPLTNLAGIGSLNGWLPSDKAVVFVSNHDDQRYFANDIVTFRDPGDLNYIAEIFMLAYPYGYPKVMSSYYFNSFDQGPPGQGANSGDSCGGGWVCEHRWRGIANMVAFRNVSVDEWRVTNWWSGNSNQIAFGRGGKGFVVINRDGNQLSATIQTGMASGEYCDIVNGNFTNGSCDGPTIQVNQNGEASFSVQSIGAAAIHVGAKLGDCNNDCGCTDCGDNDNGWSEAYFRGTPNAWGTSLMQQVNGNWQINVTFSNGDSSGPARFKISRFQDWSESYPAEDFVVNDGPGLYEITFNDSSKSISATKLDDNAQQPDDPNDSELVSIELVCNNGNTYFGQSVYAVGNISQLGIWSPNDALKLEATNYPTWSTSLEVTKDSRFEWKCLKRDESNPLEGVEWQGGNNQVVVANSEKTSTGNF